MYFRMLVRQNGKKGRRLPLPVDPHEGKANMTWGNLRKKLSSRHLEAWEGGAERSPPLPIRTGGKKRRSKINAKWETSGVLHLLPTPKRIWDGKR